MERVGVERKHITLAAPPAPARDSHCANRLSAVLVLRHRRRCVARIAVIKRPVLRADARTRNKKDREENPLSHTLIIHQALTGD